MMKRMIFLTATFLAASFITACASTGKVTTSADDDSSQVRKTAQTRERQ